MKRIYVAAIILMAVAITEGCMKQRMAQMQAAQLTKGERQ
ncbi:hypothetical protein GGR35_002538 [Mucilaginibacter phyllosphaerae]|uniref:Uncharacterized protein n=1 Tax=Mucilaginibacter phyllosphaerae TaxID=1812349 RepID=A0ABR6IA64_9SPHI|nr:hypothetical protein [Mucilaginibacter phyllosphaerae]